MKWTVAIRCPALALLTYLLLSGSSSEPSRAVPAEIGPEAHRVLVLFSRDRLFPPNVLFDEHFREVLASEYTTSIEYRAEYLDEERFPSGYVARMQNLLAEKYGSDPADVVVAFGATSLDFCLENRHLLFRRKPIVYAGVEMRSAPPDSARNGSTGVLSTSDARATIRLALRLHPRTRQAFLVTRTAESDLAAAEGGSDRFHESEFDVAFHDIAVESPGDSVRLPKQGLVFDLMPPSHLGGDSGFSVGWKRWLSEKSAVPIYSVTDPLIAPGTVGAVTTPADSVAVAAADLVATILSRTAGDPLPPTRTLSARAVFDSRQLRRWGIKKSHLPEGSIVRFEPRSFWRQHLLLVITTGTLILLQSGLIVSLVVQSRRRRRAELEARYRREELGHMTRVATVGELTASLAHEINQPLAAILSNAQAAQRLLSKGNEHVDEIGEILADIAADDRRAGDVIRRMRTFLRKEDSKPSDLDLCALVEETAALVRSEMLLQNITLVFEHPPDVLLVHGDRVQLQQVVLNLMVNALDAMREGSNGARKLVVRMGTTNGGRAVETMIQDDGVGIPSDRLERIFDPFYTTKTHGLGLGLSICRSIIETHGGRMGCESGENRGTVVWFTLPIVEKEL